MIQRIILFFLPLFFWSCQPEPELSGVVNMPEDSDWARRVYLIQPENLEDVSASFRGKVVDSSEISADGRFAFVFLPQMEEGTLFQLAIQKKGERFLNRLNTEDPAKANYHPIICHGGQRMEISADAAFFQSSFSIRNPNSANLALLQLTDIRRKAHKIYMEKISHGEQEASFLLEEEAAYLEYQQAVMAFAENTGFLLPALQAVRWVSPEGDYERVPEFLVSQCLKWEPEYPKHSWVQELCEMADPANLPLLSGVPMPNFALPMLSGDTTDLYELLGEKLTLVDLWASWCAPCRRENRNVLIPLWEAQQEMGFQILGYALEASRKPWEKAIEKDGISMWPHASHLQGDEAPFMESLRIQTIPANFLLDAEGRVLAKNLHGETLTKFVEDYLQK
ncbi:MAG: TlpA family protein disulfide reductase [Bacteroidetes bacterium]|nr:TlpA family protein disulfide reductase [Bacteroidota bacterium]